MEPRSGGRLVRPALTIVLCALYLLLAGSLSLLSGQAYQATAHSSDDTFLPRTALSYLANQVRRGDEAGGLSVTRFGDSDALALEEDGYVTRTVYPEVPPRVEYALTERTRSLLPHIDALIGWAQENKDAIMDDRRKATATPPYPPGGGKPASRKAGVPK